MMVPYWMEPLMAPLDSPETLYCLLYYPPRKHYVPYDLFSPALDH